MPLSSPREALMVSTFGQGTRRCTWSFGTPTEHKNCIERDPTRDRIEPPLSPRFARKSIVTASASFSTDRIWKSNCTTAPYRGYCVRRIDTHEPCPGGGGDSTRAGQSPPLRRSGKQRLRRPVSPPIRNERPYSIRVDLVLKLNEILIEDR